MLLYRRYKNKPSIPMAIGQISLTLTILLQRFLIKPEMSDPMRILYESLSGLFLGLSLVFNLTGLIVFRQKN